MQLTQVLEANRRNAQKYPGPGLVAQPARDLALVTCMDVRVDPRLAFGVELGETHLMRNAGGRVTDDVLRSLALSCHRFGVREVGIVHHTDCGLQGDEDSLRAAVEEAAGGPVPFSLGAIDDPDRCLADDVRAVQEAAFLPDDVLVWGARYDVTTGRLEVVVQPATAAPSATGGR